MTIGARDGGRCVDALVARIARQFSEGVSWIQREYPEVLDEAMQERMKRELLAQLEIGRASCRERV